MLKPIISNIDDIFSYDTSLVSPATAGANTISVKSIVNFGINQILLIGELGAEDSEIIKTHASTAPTGSTITLASNLLFTHPVYTKITVLLYDQIEYSYSTDLAGISKTLLTTTIGNGIVAMTGDSKEVRWDDTQFNSGYYWARYKNSITGIFTTYTGPIPYAGYDSNTVGNVISKALKRCHIRGYSEFIDYEFCLDEINECLRFISGKLKKWAKLQEFDFVLGQTSRGVYKYLLPSNISENENNKSIFNIHIGKNNSLKFKTITEWNEDVMKGVKRSEVRTQAVAGQTTLEINNSYDFADAGTVNLYISGVIYTLSYTSITRSATAGVLNGIPASGTGAISITIPINTNVWSGEGETKPRFYTIYGGYLYIELPQTLYSNQNLYIDYETTPDVVTSDEDVLDTFRFDAVLHWLVWVINAQQKNKGKRDMQDADYMQFLQNLSDYIRNETMAHGKKNKPKINGITYRNSRR